MSYCSVVIILPFHFTEVIVAPPIGACKIDWLPDACATKLLVPWGNDPTHRGLQNRLVAWCLCDKAASTLGQNLSLSLDMVRKSHPKFGSDILSCCQDSNIVDSNSLNSIQRTMITSASVPNCMYYCAFGIFQKVIFCLVLYKEVNLQTFVMI